jgi:hypothetical protein
MTLGRSLPLVLLLACSGSDRNIGSLEKDPAVEPPKAAEPSGPAVSQTDPIDPIAVGNSWTFDVKTSGSSLVGCEAGVHAATVTEKSTVDGREAFAVHSFCPSIGTFYYAWSGDRVWMQQNGAWLLQVDAPVEAGHVWQNGTANVMWRDEGTVTVAAGTFSRCYRAEVNATTYTILCRGVGPVRSVAHDGTGNGYDAELMSFNLVSTPR